MTLKKDVKNRAKLVKLVDKYVNRIINSTSWTIEKNKIQMIWAIERIMKYKKGKLQ